MNDDSAKTVKEKVVGSDAEGLWIPVNAVIDIVQGFTDQINCTRWRDRNGEGGCTDTKKSTLLAVVGNRGNEVLPAHSKPWGTCRR